jgi:hypothetical protein
MYIYVELLFKSGIYHYVSYCTLIIDEEKMKEYIHRDCDRKSKDTDS